jgi:hypothetical protein
VVRAEVSSAKRDGLACGVLHWKRRYPRGYPAETDAGHRSDPSQLAASSHVETIPHTNISSCNNCSAYGFRE